MKEQRFFLDNASNFELVSKFITIDFGKLNLFPFEVMLTPFQCNSIMFEIKFHFKFTFSGVNVLVILNK